VSARGGRKEGCGGGGSSDADHVDAGKEYRAQPLPRTRREESRERKWEGK